MDLWHDTVYVIVSKFQVGPVFVTQIGLCLPVHSRHESMLACVFRSLTCSGSLIDTNWVITAAGCINTATAASDYSIRVGSNSPNESTTNLQTIAVQEYFIHEVTLSSVLAADALFMFGQHISLALRAKVPVSLFEKNKFFLHF